MRHLIVGDIHGNYLALMDVLEMAKFDSSKDTLYAVGDYIDGHKDSKKVIEYLSNLKNFKGCLGNHDAWMIDYTDHPDNIVPFIWYSQGGKATLESYGADIDISKGLYNIQAETFIPEHHKEFLYDLKLYIEVDNYAIVHAGWQNGNEKIEDSYSYINCITDFYWDRYFWTFYDKQDEPAPYDAVFIGHTSYRGEPRWKGNVCNLDTGGGWNGKITVMDMDTKEYWQSKKSTHYYPDFNGR